MTRTLKLAKVYPYRPGDPVRVCLRCLTQKPADQFPVDKRKANCVDSQCCDCQDYRVMRRRMLVQAFLPRPKLPRSSPKRDAILRALADGLRALAEIAAATGQRHEYIREVARDHGIKITSLPPGRRPRPTPGMNIEVIRLRRQWKAPAEIQRQLGLTKGQVAGILYRYRHGITAIPAESLVADRRAS